VLGICAFALLAVPSAAVAGTGSISGTVTDAGTHAGLGEIEVCAYTVGSFEEFEFEEEFEFSCALTESDGTYGIEELEPGEYEVEFWPGEQNYFTQYYSGKSSPFEADAVVVGGADVPNVNAQLTLAGRITGTVTTALGGTPVGEVEVCASKAATELERCTETKSDGTYALSRLSAGGYKVEFWPGFLEANLVTQYYDHKSRWSEANTVSVSLGTTQPGIDAALEAGAEIQGTVFSASGTPLPEILVCAIEASSNELAGCTETEFTGLYAVDGLSSGPYKVGFSIEFKEFFGEEIFSGENDGFLTRFYNEQSTLAAANPINLIAPNAAAGINAHLQAPSAPVKPAAPSVPVLSTPIKKTQRGLHCHAGFKKKKVKGKLRCVKAHKRRHHKKHRADARQQRLIARLR
jgi:hypothetical protein